MLKQILKLFIVVAICGLALYGAYCLWELESPAEQGIRDAIRRFMEHE